jgi:dipeptidyl aminopeptidase/acylaminoacyl peptidase
MTRKFQSSDTSRVVSAGKPQISPNGSLVSIIVSQADLTANRISSELHVIDTRSGRDVLSLGPTWQVTESRWAPDNRRLAILAQRTTEERSAQIYILDLTSRTPAAVTHASERIVQLAWSPDGKQIAHGREAPLDLPRVDGRLVSFEVKESGYLAMEPRRRVQLWAAQADGAGEAQLTRGDWTLQVPFQGSGPLILPFAWFPDGKSIVIATQSDPDVDQAERELRRVNLLTGDVQPLLGPEARAMNPVVSPDGREVAYWEYPRPGGAFSFAIRTVDVEKKTVRPEPSAPLDRNLTLALWLPNGGDILVGGHDDEWTALWIQCGSGPPLRLKTGDLDLVTRYRVEADVSKTGAIVFVASTPLCPPELYFMEGTETRPRRLTDYNSALSEFELGRSTMLRWQTHDGFEANGVVTLPPGFQPDRRYPLVVMAHGGPMMASTLGWNSFRQELAARDWIVFEPNYRGSDNVGRAFQAAIVGDMGEGPGRDVMAGLDALKTQGIIDEGRVAVTGESYGGYISAWLIGHYSGWCVAVLAAPMLDTNDSYDLADCGKTASGRLAGTSPWESGGQAAHRRQSPLAAFASIKTPTLFLSTVLDHRVPIASSYRMFHALRENNVETRFFAYPVDGHGTSDPIRELDWNRRWIAWVAEHFDPSPSVRATPAKPEHG